MSYHTRDDWDAAVEKFNGEVILAYQNADLYGTDKCMFKSADSGETFNYPVLGATEARNEADGIDITTTATGLAGDITTPKLEVDEPLKDNRMIPLDQIEIRPDLQLPMAYAKALGRAVARGKTIRINNLLALAAESTADGTQQVETLDTSVADLGADVKTVLNTIAAAFDEAGVPAEGRHVMLKSTIWYELLGVDGIYTKEYGGMAKVQRPGEFIMYANWAIHNGKVGFGTDYTATPWAARLPAKYEYDATNLLAVAWHDEAWAMQEWSAPRNMYDWVALYNAYKSETRTIIGTEVIQDEAVYIIEEGTAP